MAADATDAHLPDDDAHVGALVAEVVSLRDDNTSLRGELARTQGALATLRVRYHQLVEELHLLKRRLTVAKAERLDDVADAQLAFDKLLVETEAMKMALDVAGGDASTEAAGSVAGDAASADPTVKPKKRLRTGPPPTGRRRLDEIDESTLPVVRVEITDPDLEGKAPRIGVEESSCVGYERGGFRRLVKLRVVYKESVKSETDASTAQGAGPSPAPSATSSELAPATAAFEAAKTDGALDPAGAEPEATNDQARARAVPNASFAAETTCAAPSASKCRASADAESSVEENGRPTAPARDEPVRIVKARMPKEIVPRGILAPSAIAHILAMKYVLGVPFFRQEKQCAIEGFALDRGTMCRYAEHVGATLGCIVEAAREEAITTAVCLSTDATGHAIQPTRLEDGKRQVCRKGHFFVTLADKDHVFLDFQPKHTSLTVWNMFKGFSGYVQADAHVIYDALFKGIPPEGAKEKPGECGPPPTEVGCYSHVRRKYWEAAICRHPLGLHGVKLIDAIFAADRELASLAPAQRKLRRDASVRPLVDQFFEWARAEFTKVEKRNTFLPRATTRRAFSAGLLSMRSRPSSRNRRSACSCRTE